MRSFAGGPHSVPIVLTLMVMEDTMRTTAFLLWLGQVRRQIVLPVKGSHLRVRRFLSQVMREMPGLALIYLPLGQRQTLVIGGAQ